MRRRLLNVWAALGYSSLIPQWYCTWNLATASLEQMKGMSMRSHLNATSPINTSSETVPDVSTDSFVYADQRNDSLVAVVSGPIMSTYQLIPLLQLAK